MATTPTLATGKNIEELLRDANIERGQPVMVVAQRTLNHSEMSGGEKLKGIRIIILIPESTDDDTVLSIEVGEMEQPMGPADVLDWAIHTLQEERKELFKCLAHAMVMPSRKQVERQLEELMKPVQAEGGSHEQR